MGSLYEHQFLQAKTEHVNAKVYEGQPIRRNGGLKGEE